MIESDGATAEYKNGYVKGFSQVVKLLEYLSSKGLEQELILDHLKKKLAEDIRPWQQNNKHSDG